MTESQPNLVRLASGIDVSRLLGELGSNPDLWNMITARQTTPGSPHHDTECIFIRGPREQTIDAVFNDLEAINYPGYYWLGEVDKLLHTILKTVCATKVGRVMIVSLKAHGAIDRHFDDGAYAAHYDRVHLSLQSEIGNTFECGGDVAHMLPGELWWLNHRVEHSVVNASDRARLHLIVDFVRKQ